MATQDLKILAFDGSTRSGSFNRMLLLAAVEQVKKAPAVQVTQIKLTDLPMPFMNEDLEEKEGIPANAQKFIELVNDHHGLMIASPEYNGGFTAILKNAIDWASRADKNPFAMKPIFIMGTSIGAFAAVRSSIMLRHSLSHLGAAVQPQAVLVPNAGESFSEGKLVNPISIKQVAKASAAFVEWVGKLS